MRRGTCVAQPRPGGIMAQIRIQPKRSGLGWLWLIIVLIIIAIIAWFLFVPRSPTPLPARPSGTAPSSLPGGSSDGSVPPLIAA
jgi:hypothetical protein